VRFWETDVASAVPQKTLFVIRRETKMDCSQTAALTDVVDFVQICRTGAAGAEEYTGITSGLPETPD